MQAWDPLIFSSTPATSRAPVIVRLIEEGARLMRINFSHGTFNDFQTLLGAIRDAAKARAAE